MQLSMTSTSLLEMVAAPSTYFIQFRSAFFSPCVTFFVALRYDRICCALSSNNAHLRTAVLPVCFIFTHALHVLPFFPFNNSDLTCQAQNLYSFLGKVLKIRLYTAPGATGYGVPPENPFASEFKSKP
jgi:hypothetical protein